MGKKARRITAEQAQRAFRHLRTDRDRLLFGTMLLSGARIGEAIQLRQGDAFRFGAGSTVVPRANLDIRPEIAKRNHGGRVPIGPDLAEILRRYPVHLAQLDPSAPLFPSRKGAGFLSRSAAWRVICGAFRRAAVEDASPHSLRHAFCTLLVARRVSLPVIRELMRHGSLKTTDRYVGEVSEAELRAAIESLGVPLFHLAGFGGLE